MNTRCSKNFWIILLSSLGFSMWGCRTIEVEEIPSTADPSAEISLTQSQIDSAQQNQVDVLSPDHFRDAEKKLKAAKELREENAASKDILYRVAESRAHLKKANEFAKLSEAAIPEVVAARRQALEANAPNLVKKELRQADKELTDVTEEIEMNDTKPAVRNKDKLRARYDEVRIKALREAYAEPSRKVVKQAVDEGAKKLAPQTLAGTEQSIEQIEMFISEHPADRSGIERLSHQVATDADRLLRITRESKVLGNQNAETLVLEREAKDMQLAQEERRLRSTEQNLQTMQSENTNLAAEKAFNDRFLAAQAEFGEKEADVFREGSQLVLRLKGLSFPNGKATLAGSQYNLLNKVRDVVEDFSPAMITVEGHTDATGNESNNKKLSLARARAVQDYLVASGMDISKLQFNVVGHGSERPVASNKTAAGRAQNRRVDVVIQPTQTLTSSL